jgi:hypothetical protein
MILRSSGFGKSLAAVLAALSLVAAGPSPEIQAKARAFLSRPEQVDAVREAVLRQAASLPRACGDLAFKPVEVLVAEPPAPRFDESGTMIEGSIRERFASGGCPGFAPLFNVWTVAAPGQAVRTFMAYPGTSSASVELQRMATPTATVAAGRVAPGCGSLDVLDTKDIGFDAAAGSGARPWREVWLVGGCDIYVTVLLRFVPEKDGIVAVDAPPDGVRRVALR